MKMFNSQTLIFVAIALVLAFSLPLKAQDQSQDYLIAHNRVRASVRVPSLVWSETLAIYARRYAIQRMSACDAETTSGGPYGENIVWTPTDHTAYDAVNAWVAESAYYNYDTNTCLTGRKCNRYTQVVWKKTTSLGCAKVKCSALTLTVCSYFPAGNAAGERPY